MNQLSVTKTLALAVLILLPFWALPILPGTFRPISMFLTLPLGLMYLLTAIREDKLEKTEVLLLMFFLTALFFSCVQFAFLGGGASTFIIGNFLLALGIFGYFGFRFCLREFGLTKVLGYVKAAIYIIVAVGWFDVLGWLGIIPDALRGMVNYAIAGKSSSRIVLTVSEPAWASRLALCFLPFAYYFWSVERTLLNKFALGSLFIFFLLCFSLSGIVVLLSAIGLYLISQISIKVIFKTFILIVVLCTSLFFVFEKMKEEGGYFVSRFDKIASIESVDSLMTLEALAAIDGSALIRIGYPWIALQVAFDEPLGIGVGRYPEYFNEKITQYGKIVTNDIAVAEHIAKKSADQRSYFIKVYSETGLLSLFLVCFYVSIHRKLKVLKQKFEGKHVHLYKLCIALLLSMFVCYGNMIQFASFIFPFYWFAPAMVNYLYLNEEKS
ncbi:hypothetical protein [Pseudoalteromonas luteoviolacea]|uniref:O-antigen polymerase n=1 Tax=Pseudoalteromonas luteoviolacea H33 TaxID=1365251 RepID=A0A167EYU5_9GAMM|nr:hypothetical protein [Pseudoalteromonas luteoviolacea]KZN51377.1 hypothetical protein N476_13395 [Pseudoalteromonas luteoviolacea H33]KZN71452.1 hypothetical protein N477_04025 [Pseudoalteromonas luteoviolacea H33-S]MBQ4876808.1 hypothetical protein [Pseudoalteromonas luteoviolacea]MBQ4905403.1 hypothetical protein [Pseudoalteromonas luteoviolacea]